RAFVRLLQKAGVDFAILGSHETCNGDPASRIGNEYLYQTQAQQNIAAMTAAKVRKVIASCPHCFNTIKNEFPQFGGNYEVVHHTQLLASLVKEGRLRPSKAIDGRSRPPHPAAGQPGQRGPPQAEQGDRRQVHLPRLVLSRSLE